MKCSIFQSEIFIVHLYPYVAHDIQPQNERKKDCNR